MKTSKKHLFGVAILLVTALTFTACEGPVGPAGPQGEAGDSVYIGDNGNWWINGVDTGELVDGIINITKPAKTLYSTGEAFTSEGLVVNVYYSDGSVDIIDAGDYSLLWNNTTITDGNTAISAETGNKTITVKWHNKIATFTILVQN